MRLWHKDVISALPDKQLLGQWRECCLIAKNIREKGSPNHVLVNPIMNYPLAHFYRYCGKTFGCMQERGFRANADCLLKYVDNPDCGNAFWNAGAVENSELFAGWHSHRYLRQCYYNLQEKYDCGAITNKEWERIAYKFDSYFSSEVQLAKELEERLCTSN